RAARLHQVPRLRDPRAPRRPPRRGPGAGGGAMTAAPPLPDHDPRAAALAPLTKAFQARLHLPDLGALHATLGAVAANRMRGDPVWLLLVGPPSSGKTELIGSLAKLPGVHWAALLTEAALLSGTSTK